MLDKINAEIKIAMKNKDTFRLMVLRMMKSQIEEESKKKKNIGSDIDVLVAYSNKLKKGLTIKNIPQVFIDKTNAELAIVQSFLPQQLLFDEAVKIARDFLASNPNIGSPPANKSEVIAHIKKTAKDLKKICPGRIAFLGADKALSKE